MAEKEVVTEILTYREKLGLEKGLEKGRQEGQLAGMRKMVLTLIESRFGALPAGDRDLFEQLSFERLETIGLAARFCIALGLTLRHRGSSNRTPSTTSLKNAVPTMLELE